MLQFFVFFSFLEFCQCTSLKLMLVKVHKVLFCVTYLLFVTISRAICFGTPNINTQIYTNFFNFYQVF